MKHAEIRMLVSTATCCREALLGAKGCVLLFKGGREGALVGEAGCNG